jgi:hypothetical protein
VSENDFGEIEETAEGIEPKNGFLGSFRGVVIDRDFLPLDGRVF